LIDIRGDQAPAGFGARHGAQSCGWGSSVRERTNVAARVVAGGAVAAALAVLVAACSPGADYPGILDKPTPRADQPMSPAEVKQATDALISDRDRLSADAQAAQTAAVPAAPASTGSTRAAGAAPKP
jgi:hypothetical protein